MQERQPLPVFVHLTCPTCGGVGTAEKGSQVLCQNCVNVFLSKNVGLMEEVIDNPNSPDLVLPTMDDAHTHGAEWAEEESVK